MKIVLFSLLFIVSTVSAFASEASRWSTTNPAPVIKLRYNAWGRIQVMGCSSIVLNCKWEVIGNPSGYELQEMKFHSTTRRVVGDVELGVTAVASVFTGVIGGALAGEAGVGYALTGGAIGALFPPMIVNGIGKI